MSHFSPARRGLTVCRCIPRVQLHLEALEDRTLPAVMVPSLVVNPQVFDSSHMLVKFESAAANHSLPPGLAVAESLLNDLYTVKVPQGIGLEKALDAVRTFPGVAYAEPDYEVRVNLIPSDSYFGSLWGLHNTGQSGGKLDADIDAPEAWDVSTGTGNVVVAVIDTGVDYTHPELAANMWVNTGEIPGNGIDDDGNGFVDDIHGYDFVNNDGDPMDDHSHGTHVAGTIGAVGNNGSGVAGVIWNVQIMALKFLGANGSGSTSNAIRALNYAVANGAQISNNSWGGGGYSQALYDAINNARAHGHIFVAAAGNSGVNTDSSPAYPASYNLNNIVAVAATDRYDNLASFSNYGATTVDLGAPGVSILSTTPGNTYSTYSGTSMATPHVAGALALLKDLNPTWTYTQLIHQLLSTVDPLPSLAGKTVSGGRLNLARAIGAPTPPIPSLSINSVSVLEGNSGTTSAVFTVTLSTASSQTVTVNYATANGTATAGSDYVAKSGSLTFAAGETVKQVAVSVNGDTIFEPNETFFVNLSNPVNAFINVGQGVGTILNDDPGVTISINDVSQAEGQRGTSNFVFTVTLSAPSSQTITVNFVTANGTAVAGSDYNAASGSLSFSPGQTSKTITIRVKGDTVVEPNETFFVNLFNPTNATLAKAQGTGTILNDDAGTTVRTANSMETNSTRPVLLHDDEDDSAFNFPSDAAASSRGQPSARSLLPAPKLSARAVDALFAWDGLLQLF